MANSHLNLLLDLNQDFLDDSVINLGFECYLGFLWREVPRLEIIIVALQGLGAVGHIRVLLERA